MSPRGRPSRKQLLRAAPEGPAVVDVRRLVVAAELAGARLDRIVASLLPELSRARVRELAALGLISQGGAALPASARLERGAELLVRLPGARAFALAPVDLALPVLFEDEYLLVIDKPAGVAVHPGAHLRGPTVLHGLLHKLSGDARPGLAHRLDQETSGCLIVAKTQPALRGLQRAFQGAAPGAGARAAPGAGARAAPGAGASAAPGAAIEKRYRALVHGAPPDAGEFNTLHGPIDRRRFSSKVTQGQHALTRYRVLGRGAQTALLDVELLTGRTHQIRVHCADAGFPILGDKLYGGTEREAALPVDAPVRLAAAALGRQGLHAFQLELVHPITGARISCTAPLPADFRAALALLGLEGDHPHD